MTKWQSFTPGIEEWRTRLSQPVRMSHRPRDQEKGTAAAGRDTSEPSASNAKVSKKAGMPIGLSSDGVVTPSGSSVCSWSQLAYLFDAGTPFSLFEFTSEGKDLGRCGVQKFVPGVIESCATSHDHSVSAEALRHLRRSGFLRG